MKKLTLHNQTTVSAEGSRSNGNCKAVLCLDTGEVFSSITDAAEKHNIAMCNISNVVRGVCRTAGGKRYCYLAKASEYIPEMAARLSEFDSLKAKAAAYDAWQAQEAKRAKEEAKHNEKVARAQAKVDRRKTIRDNLLTELARAEARLVDAENDLNALNNNNLAIA